MKKINKKIYGIIIIFLIVCTSVFIYNNTKEEKIDKILKNEYYSYLPVKAKDYIKQIYKNTGELILTEKNKKTDTPYLNPKYVSYLELTEKERSKEELIPNPLIIEFNKFNTKNVGDANLPTTYNISNLGGLNYTTPYNNQGGSGLCWAFSSIEQAESNLMVKNGSPYNSSSDRFSVRQMDYATSFNGIKEYENENGYRLLYGYGGNYIMASQIMSNGYSLHDNSTLEFFEDTPKKELNEILNFEKTKYELNTSIMVPPLTNSSSETQKDNYNKFIKQQIIENGGAYVGTETPNGDCGFKNVDNTYAMVDQSHCTGKSGHAMQIIGWDDNYSYKYCKMAAKNVSVNAEGLCDSGALTQGTGAWILRNSWGANSAYKNVYLGYDSVYLDVNFTTNLKPKANRTWENVYHKNMWNDGILFTTTETQSYQKTIDTPEKIQAIKFLTGSVGGKYAISILSESGSYENYRTVTVDYPGTYTLDLSNDNIIINDPEFAIKIYSVNNTSGSPKYIYTNAISVFTSNVNYEPIINTNNTDSSYAKKTVNNDYNFRIYSTTKNIPSNDTITYTLQKDQTDVSNYIKSVNNNKVAINNINTELIIDKNIPTGEYTLISHYGNYTSNSSITILSTKELDGAGTQTNPYKIYTEEDLNQIRFKLSAYYEIEEDITLTNDWVPIGTFNNPFKGGLDGKNHTISNLTINSNKTSAVGFFGYVDVKYGYDYNAGTKSYDEATYIKNLKIENSAVENSGNAGILIGQLVFDSNSPAESDARNFRNHILNIDNVHLIDGTVKSLNGDAGAIVGKTIVNSRPNLRPCLNINNLYSSIDITGLHSAGLLGYINDTLVSGSGIMLETNLTNIENVGNIDLKELGIEYSEFNNYSPVVGGVYGNVKINLENYIINSIMNDMYYSTMFRDNDNSYIVGYYDEDVSSNIIIKNNNGYYVSKGIGYRVLEEYTSASDIKNTELFNSWKDFNTYWKIEQPNSIMRIPVLKPIDYHYTNIEDITICRNDDISLLDFIEGKNNFEYIDYENVSNNNVVKLTWKDTDEDGYFDDIFLQSQNPGTATIKIINNYDGYERNVNITVTNSYRRVITFNANDGTNNNTTQGVLSNESFELEKNTFTRDGYKFVKWNTSPTGDGTNYTDKEAFNNGIEEDLTLYAIWEPISYEVKFNSNNGEGTMSNQQHTYDVEKALSKNTFTNENLKFKEWNTEQDGSGISYQDEQVVKNLTDEEGKVVNLYAQWIPATYTVTFNSNGGSNVRKEIVGYGEKVMRPTPNPSKPNNNFVGWYTNSNLTKLFDFDTPITSDLTLYAKWEEIREIPVYRMYNPVTGEHLYTTDAYEVSVIYRTQGWGKEGIGWYTTDKGTPVYRLYNPRLGNHLYTSDRFEISVITRTQGWVLDFNGEPVMYASGTVPIYRLFNPGLQGQHHLTTDYNEYRIIPKDGWQQEGTAMNAIKIGVPHKTEYYR